MKIDKYFERIQLNATPSPNESGLYELQSSQLRNIPFENIDCVLKRTIHLDFESLEKKLLEQKRGGYCFELNGIFSFVLEQLKFSSRPLLARVMYRGTGINSRTHIILLVTINGKNYIADAGFGGPGTYLPVPFELNREDIQPQGIFRIISDETHGFIMQKKTDEGWYNIYAFNLDIVYPADLIMSNFFTSQFPESHFRHNLIMGRHLPKGRITLLNRTLTTVIDKESTVRELETHEELITALENHFNIKPETEFNFQNLLKF